MIEKQKGFSVLASVVIVLVIAIVGGVGYYVYSKNSKDNMQTHTTDRPSSINTDAVQDDAATDKAAEKPYRLPAGYVLYDNKELRFKFAYPNEYGEVAKQPTVNNVEIVRSDEPDVKFGPGISGKIQVFTYASADREITSRKYGPMIKLQGDKWIVTTPNESDMAANKAGDVYMDQAGKTVASKTNEGLRVYLLRSVDEGSESDRLVFISGGRLHELYLPAFSDGSYGGDAENDKSAFDALLDNIWSSIRPTQ
jgi:hypothetical protein